MPKKQLDLTFPTWGGRRPNAGRKRADGRASAVAHVTRPRHPRAFPSHVTLRARAGLGSLRDERVYLALRRALTHARKTGFRVVQFSVQEDHVHLLVEATSSDHLTRGMQGLAVRATRAVNRAMARRGSLWADRYHRRDLTTPREVRSALVYILNNHRKHGARRVLDPCSSALWFDGWSLRAGVHLADLALHEVDRDPGAPSPVHVPTTWLVRKGWRRHGEIEPEESPAT